MAHYGAEDHPLAVYPMTYEEALTMQEDVLGTRRTAFPVSYVQCARCGRPTPRQQARMVPSNALSEERSEYEYLCPNCQAELASGEPDLPATNE
jgi:DNA-directed RNA polymerase subunit RPC12/RpoP